jgi:hypothetical protein
MILLVHLLFGAATGSIIKNPVLAFLLALLGHYFLDFFPHIEYSIENLKTKKWSKVPIDIIKICLDFCIGIILIFVFSKNQPIIYVCALIALLPDGFTLISLFYKNKLLETQNNLHQNQIHILKNKKIPLFWRIFSQIVVSVISVILLRL